MKAANLRTLIVGFGHAGRDLHLPCLLRLRPLAQIGLVDPREDAGHGLDRELPWYRRIDQASAFRPADTVVHVCVPPAGHIAALEAAAELGYRRFIVEKPLAASAAEAARILALTRTGGIEVIVVANWLASALTDRLRWLLAQSSSPVTDVTMRQTKSRIRASLTRRGHTSAVEVELPHLVALARHLFGAGLEVVDAQVRDLAVGSVRLPSMGGASVRLRSPGGVRLALHSDLASPVVERSIRIGWSDGTVAHGFYPCDSRDKYSQVFVHGPDGRLAEQRFFPDDTLRRLLARSYAWFAGSGPRPVSDAALHHDVCRILDLTRQHDARKVRVA